MKSFEIRPPLGNTRGPLFTEILLRTMHRVCHTKQKFHLELCSHQGKVGLRAKLPEELRSLFLQELQDVYPGTTIHPVDKESSIPHTIWTMTLHLKPDLFMLRTHEQFLDQSEKRQLSDPVAGLLSAIRTGASGRIECMIDLQIRPATPGRIRSTKRIAERWKLGFSRPIWKRWYLVSTTNHRGFVRFGSLFLSRFPFRKEPENKEDLPKAEESLFECWLTLKVFAPADAEAIAHRKLKEIRGAFGRFTNSEMEFASSRIRKKTRVLKRGFLLTPQELATLWHPVTTSADRLSRMDRPSFREVEPPLNLISKGRTSTSETILGRVKFRQQRNQFSISIDDLRRHMICIGKTGCGKSTFLLNLVHQQVKQNRGVVLIDPHGQLVDEVLNIIPKGRTNDVVLFDAADKIAPVSFNPMIGPPGTEANLIADGVITSFKNVFGFDESSAPRLLHIFRNSLLSLIETPHANFRSLQRLLIDSHFRKTIIAQVNNESVREFWLNEFNRWNSRDRTLYIASLQNKLGAFTTNKQLQTIFNNQTHKKGIQLRTLMDESKILLCNLSKGKLGHDPSVLLGSLLLSSVHIASLSRADIPEQERTESLIVIDEFHSWLSEGNNTMSDALAESRKYRTGYILATQMLEQLDNKTLSGVLGNCGSTLCMTVGPHDAETLCDLLGLKQACFEDKKRGEFCAA